MPWSHAVNVTEGLRSAESEFIRSDADRRAVLLEELFDFEVRVALDVGYLEGEDGVGP